VLRGHTGLLRGLVHPLPGLQGHGEEPGDTTLVALVLLVLLLVGVLLLTLVHLPKERQNPQCERTCQVAR
jgi:hypothetical protein